MDCSKVEQLLSEYLESSLLAEENEHISKHLETCTACSVLLAEMKSALALCRTYPSLDMDPDFVEKILLRTSGRPRTRSFRERFNEYFLHPLLTPRFAVGASLAALFVILMANLTIPRVSGAVASLSPQELLRFMDHGVRQMYGEVLKAVAVKDEWQDQFGRFGRNTWNNMRSIMDQMDTAPVEGRKKQDEEREQQKQKDLKEKSSGLSLWPA